MTAPNPIGADGHPAQPPRIWIDADACPQEIKGILYNASVRNRVPLILVANSAQRLPDLNTVSQHIVPSGTDVADDYIATHCGPGDLVITADIPLASRVVAAGATGLNPRGELYTEENVESILSMRDFMQEMRNMGMVEGGPAPLRQRDNQQFANALDRFLTRALRNRKG